MCPKNKRVEFAAAAVLLGTAMAAAGDAAALKGQADRPPLVRRDLIPTAPKKISPPKRDPFTTQFFMEIAGGLGLTPAGEPRDVQGAPQGDPGAASAEPAGPPPPDIRYVGCILGRIGRTGLILFDGQALAVSSGEELPRGWKTGAITETSFEAIDPDGNIRRILLEGERK